jgi:hypothetical protein
MKSSIMSDAARFFERDLQQMRQRREAWAAHFDENGVSRRPDRRWGNLPRPLRAERHRPDAFWREA